MFRGGRVGGGSGGWTVGEGGGADGLRPRLGLAAPRQPSPKHLRSVVPICRMWWRRRIWGDPPDLVWAFDMGIANGGEMARQQPCQGGETPETWERKPCTNIVSSSSSLCSMGT